VEQVLALNPVTVLPESVSEVVGKQESESKVEIEWAEQVSALEPLQVEPESGLEILTPLEIEMGQE
jgi:hypothetical protein